MLLLAMKGSRNWSEYTADTEASDRRRPVLLLTFIFLSVVSVCSYLNVGAKKLPAARKETQVGFYFFVLTTHLLLFF